MRTSTIEQSNAPLRFTASLGQTLQYNARQTPQLIGVRVRRATSLKLPEATRFLCNRSASVFLSVPCGKSVTPDRVLLVNRHLSKGRPFPGKSLQFVEVDINAQAG